MSKFFLIPILTFTSLISYGQLKADSLTIYKDFNGRGTTASLWHYHKNADSLKIPLQKLDPSDLITIKNTFTDVKVKKYHQQKHGGELLLGFVYVNGQKGKIAISSYSKSVYLVNFTDRKYLLIEDSVKAMSVRTILLKYSK